MGLLRFWGKYMKIYACHFHPNGFFISTEAQHDFWFFLGPLIGWGRFSMIRPDKEFTPGGGIFQLSEVLPANSEPPSSVIEESNVLWHLSEALEVLKSARIFSHQEDLQHE